MKFSSLILAVLFLSSCSISVRPLKTKIQPKNYDMSAKSAPITGFDYYSVPSSAPSMNNKLKSSKNTKTSTTKKTIIKK